ncbi:MAG: ribonuclease III [Chloroflexi bacterium]|nr:ribonuclease III [Chloroflexota bacterium]
MQGRQQPDGRLPPCLWREVNDGVAGHRFEDPKLLETALTHGSYVHEHPDEAAADFERLEFLGDAVIDLVVGEELYQRSARASEGELTALRARVVSGESLATVAKRLGLPERARLGAGEEASGGRGRIGLAASLFESVIGAVYVDGGFEAARDVILRAMHDEIESTDTAPRKSAKSVLQERAQAERHPLPVYRVVEERGPEHSRDFVIEVEAAGRVAKGEGRSKREAEEAAASKLLEEVGWS